MPRHALHVVKGGHVSEPARTVFVRVATDDGWRLFSGPATEAQIDHCYRLNSRASRAAYWSSVLNQDIPAGRGLIWWTGKERVSN